MDHPACAGIGRTPEAGGRSMPTRDHPRVCGDKQSRPTTAMTYTGPPPRAQGRLGQHLADEHVPRITPARAGTTWLVPRATADRTDHPACAGQHRGRAGALLQLRTTPACAGTTHSLTRSAACTSDHPRVDGATGRFSRCRPTRTDHPRVRGRQPDDGCGVHARRTTPTWAGTTSRRSSSSWNRTVHPRGRGHDQVTLRRAQGYPDNPRRRGEDDNEIRSRR